MSPGLVTIAIVVALSPLSAIAPSPAAGCDWTVVASPNLGTGDNTLRAVAAIGPTNAWAVGYARGEDGFDQTLTMQWDGAAWTIVPSPSPGRQADRLYGVTALSSNDVWAVGSTTGEGTDTLILHWDGSLWTQVASPNPSPDENLLFDVEGVSGDDVWAVGLRDIHNDIDRPLAVHWDGSAWKTVRAKGASGTRQHSFRGVTTASADDVFAAGTVTAPTGSEEPGRPLIMRWDGARWQRIAAPGPGSDFNELNDVEAVTAGDAWAVGRWENVGEPMINTLIEHWDGSRWRVTPSPNGPTGSNELHGVAATSSSDVWAVGVEGTNALALRWDGKTWDMVPTQNPGPDWNVFFDVAASGPTDVWAVGETIPLGKRRTLIEHHC